MAREIRVAGPLTDDTEEEPIMKVLRLLGRSCGRRFEREKAELRQLGLSAKSISLGAELAIELSACTCMASSETWRFVRRFLEVYAKGYKTYKSQGFDLQNMKMNIHIDL